MTARIVLVRHAEPARSARGRAIGRTDVGLSREGVRQARELVSNLAATGVDRVVSSPSMRAIRTAEPVARTCGAPLEVDADLREIDFGAFDGRTFASIEREHPELYATWMRAPTAVVFPDGETWPALRERAERAIERIAKTGEGRTTVAVTHLGVILATLGRARSVPDEDVFRLTVDHAATFVVDVAEGAWIFRSVSVRP